MVMVMNLFGREMKASLKSLMIWTVGIVVMVMSGMAKYAGMAESGDSMNELMADLPKSMQAVFGVGELDIATPVGYYGVLFLYLLIMAAVHASMLGANIVSKEERDKTSEFLLTKPITRSWILGSKIGAAVVNVLIFNVVMLVSSISSVGMYAEGQPVTKEIWPLMLGMLLVQLVFMSIGLAIAGAGRRPKLAVAMSATVMLLAYLLSMVIEVSGKLDALRFLTPFQYVDASSVIDRGLEAGFVWLALLIVVICLVVTFAGYTRRDILS
ncbi:ABC transporter permease subunit [Paenibacillus sp. strain BS8-2]